MEKEPAGFFQRKTTWAALTALIGALSGFLTGAVSPGEAVTIAINSVFALTLRSAIATQPTE